MTNRTLLSMEQLAALLGKSPDWLSRNRKALEEGTPPFPKPVFGDGGPGQRWDPKAINLWLDAHIDPLLMTARHHTGTAPDTLDLRLSMRADELAAQGPGR